MLGRPAQRMLVCFLQDAMSGGDACGAGSSSCGRWLLEALVEGGACYLLEPSSGRVFSDPPEGQWPKPVGASGMVCWCAELF